MKRQTRRLLLNIAAGVAIAAAVTIVVAPAMAFTGAGTIVSDVSVHSEAGDEFAVVATARAGEFVSVGDCRSNFCFITRSGEDGWIPEDYVVPYIEGSVQPSPEPDPGQPEPEFDPGLPQPEPDPGQPQPDPEPDPGSDNGFSLEFDFGNDGPSIDFGIGDDQPDIAYVCFYERTRMRGQRVCLEQGERAGNLGDFANRISSIDNPFGLRVTVCTDRNFNGSCATVRDSLNTLGDFDDEISSLRVR